MSPTLDAIASWARHTADQARQRPTLTEDQRAGILIAAGVPLSLLIEDDGSYRPHFGPHTLDFINGTWSITQPTLTLHK